MGISPGQKKVVVITRWLYKQGGRKAGFHCIPLRTYPKLLLT